MYMISTRLDEFIRGIDSYEIVGYSNSEVTNIVPISSGSDGSFTWLNSDRKDKDTLISQTDSTFVVMHRDETFNPKDGQIFIKVNNPKLFFVKAVSRYSTNNMIAHIHQTAVISKEAIIHPNVRIGAFCVIEKCTIDEGTIIDSHTKIGEDTTIGKRVKIASGVVIGSDGFGYVEDENGLQIKFPHIGGVIIEDDVEIGANTCIDRGTLDYTLLKSNSKIDNLVHIAHNVIIGHNSLIIANTMIGGSTVIGDHSWVAPSATIRDGISVGSSSVVGLGALVTKSIPDNQVWAGFPAKFIRDNSNKS